MPARHVIPIHPLPISVITYDRAGFGQSSLDTADYSILQEIKSLETALHQFSYSTTNLLLVGQSLGAFYNWVYAARQIEQIVDFYQQHL